jgi:hypothetical protein
MIFLISISISWVARIMGMSHWCPAKLVFKKCDGPAMYL